MTRESVQYDPRPFPIDVIALPTVARHGLRNVGIKTIGDMLLLEKNRFQHIRWVGRSSVRRIEEYFDEVGLKGGDDVGKIFRPGISLLWDVLDQRLSAHFTSPSIEQGVGWGPLRFPSGESWIDLRERSFADSLDAFSFVQSLIAATPVKARINASFCRIPEAHCFDLIDPASLRYFDD